MIKILIKKTTISLIWCFGIGAIAFFDFIQRELINILFPTFITLFGIIIVIIQQNAVDERKEVADLFRKYEELYEQSNENTDKSADDLRKIKAELSYKLDNLVTTKMAIVINGLLFIASIFSFIFIDRNPASFSVAKYIIITFGISLVFMAIRSVFGPTLGYAAGYLRRFDFLNCPDKIKRDNNSGSKDKIETK